MVRISFAVPALAIVLSLGSCATLTEEQCQLADWSALGFLDGQKGYRHTRIGDHTKACAEHGLTSDTAAYLAGWRQGIVGYCTAQNGYDQGIDGKTYRNSCPGELAAPFKAAYRPARRFHDAEEEVQRLERATEERLDLLQRLAGSEDPADRERLEDANQDLTRLRRELRWAKDELRATRRALDAYLRAHRGTVAR